MSSGTTANSPVTAGQLYVVATPIGNLADLSSRAQDILRGVTRIAAEDTRTTSVLLRHFGIHTSLIAMHDHNEDALAGSLITALRKGESLALVSDAGTPLISDPGYALVRAAREAGVTVIAIPGPCAATAALSICGLPTDSFIFAGFLPAKTQARQQKLQQLSAEVRTLVFYESSHRIIECVADMVKILGAERRLFLGRELTKRFEQSLTASAASVSAWLQEDENHQRGEFVLIAAGAETATDHQDSERVLKLLLAELPPSRAARLAAEITGAPRKTLYDLALKLTPSPE